MAANFRTAYRGRSSAGFIAKLGNALEEADETAFWLETIGEAELIPTLRLTALSKEAGEITAILFSAQ